VATSIDLHHVLTCVHVAIKRDEAKSSRGFPLRAPDVIVARRSTVEIAAATRRTMPATSEIRGCRAAPNGTRASNGTSLAQGLAGFPLTAEGEVNA
jgi:hypothetical protein